MFTTNPSFEIKNFEFEFKITTPTTPYTVKNKINGYFTAYSLQKDFQKIFNIRFSSAV
jgi:ribosomal protein S17E